MKYSVTVNGKNYELPARNEEMDKLIVRMESIADLVRYGEISRKDSLREQYDFVSMCVPESMPDFADIDVSDLEVARMEIVNAYNEPVIKAKIETVMEAVQAIVNNPAVKDLDALSAICRAKNR